MSRLAAVVDRGRVADDGPLSPRVRFELRLPWAPLAPMYLRFTARDEARPRPAQPSRRAVPAAWARFPAPDPGADAPPSDHPRLRRFHGKTMYPIAIV